MATIILPGIGGSGPEHWQTLWERDDPSLVRFAPTSWDEPELTDWLAALDRSVTAAPSPPLLLAHSLACLMVVHWLARSPRPVAGAVLVAVPDPAGPRFPPEAASFGGVPRTRLPCPTLIMASSDDPYGTLDHARDQATAWGAALIDVGPLGHINASSGHGHWEEGRRLVAAFRAGTRRD